MYTRGAVLPAAAEATSSRAVSIVGMGRVNNVRIVLRSETEGISFYSSFV